MSNEPWPSVRLIGLTLPVQDEDYGQDQLEMDTANHWGQPAQVDLSAGLDLIEFAGRWDYGPKSIKKFGDRSIIKRWLDGGEESMIEMVDALFLVTCSRVVSHELVRHRLASYQQESQRFVAYEDEAPADLFYTPDEIKQREAADPEVLAAYQHAASIALNVYLALRAAKVPKQIARYLLPNATRTRIVVKMNLREWRHVLRLRLHTSAQPEMREVMALIHGKLARIYGPDLFPENIAEERAAR